MACFGALLGFSIGLSASPHKKLLTSEGKMSFPGLCCQTIRQLSPFSYGWVPAIMALLLSRSGLAVPHSNLILLLCIKGSLACPAYVINWFMCVGSGGQDRYQQNLDVDVCVSVCIHTSTSTTKTPNIGFIYPLVLIQARTIGGLNFEYEQVLQ